MKISKSKLPFFIIGLLVVVLLGLGRVYLQQADEEGGLIQELAQAKQKLTGVQLGPLNSQKEQLENQLAQITAQTKAARAKLPVSCDSTTASNAVLETAKACNVRITDIGSSSPAVENLAGVSFSALPIDIKVEGDLSKISNFIVELSRKFPSGVVKTVDLSMKQEAASSASIRMAIYTQGSQR